MSGSGRYTWAVSVQPWQQADAPELAAIVAGTGADAVEIPIRDGFPVPPSQAAVLLPQWSRVLADSGLGIASITAEPSRELFDLCAQLGIPVIRTMAMLDGDDYPAATAVLQEKVAGWARFAQDSGVRIAWQQHHGHFISTTSGLASFLGGLPAASVGAAWDAGHSALAGEEVPLALSEIGDRLTMINLRNGRYLTKAEGWAVDWVPGPEGMSDWAEVGTTLRAMEFTGTVCLAAQYSNPEPDVAAELTRDLAFARSVFEV